MIDSSNAFALNVTQNVPSWARLEPLRRGGKLCNLRFSHRIHPLPPDSLLSTLPRGWMEERVDGRMQCVKKMSKMHAWKNVQNACVKKMSKMQCVKKCPKMSKMSKKTLNYFWHILTCLKTCVENAWKKCPGIALTNLSKTQHFCTTFFHTFFIRFSDPFSRARAFYNFTFMRKFSHHMLDISRHTYVLDLFFTRTSWTLFHTCILDMFSHP